MRALELGHEYLLEGGVFTEDLIEQIRLRPHPYEFAKYYDI